MKFESGVYTVIPTPFKDNLVDYDSLIKIINFQISSGIKNIVLLGTTSETPTLDDEEQDKIVNIVWENFKGKVNIIVGIGGNNTKNTIKKGILYKDICDAFMLTVPYYNKPSQNGIYKHFSSIAEIFSDKPIMLYNIPSRCGVSMTPEITAKLFNEYNNIGAIKEASGQVQHSCRISKLCDITVLSGDDGLTLPIMIAGGKGVVSVASNIVPKKMIEIVDLFNQEEIKKAIQINKSLEDLYEYLFVDSNPVPLKHMLSKVGLIESNIVRLPLVEIEDEKILDSINKICQEMTNNLNISKSI